MSASPHGGSEWPIDVTDSWCRGHTQGFCEGAAFVLAKLRPVGPGDATWSNVVAAAVRAYGDDFIREAKKRGIEIQNEVHEG